MVASDAVDATLRRINKDIFVERSLANAFGDVVLLGKGLACGFIPDEFDAEEQAEPANFADMRMRLQRI